MLAVQLPPLSERKGKAMDIFSDIGRAKETERTKSTGGSSEAAVASSVRQEVHQQKSAVGDLPLKGASAQTRSQQERYPGVQASAIGLQRTNVASETVKEADKRGKKGSDERDAPSSGTSEHWKQPANRVPKALWAAVVLLALALTAVTGYGYLILRENGITLSRLPGMAQVLGTLPQALGTLHSQMDATEAKLRDVTTDWASLSQQVTALNTAMRSGLARARQQTEEVILREQQRIGGEMDRRDQAINTRIAQVEAQQRAENQSLAELQKATQKNVDNVRQEMAGELEDRGRDLNALRQEVDGERSELQALAEKSNRHRVDFESAKNREQELVPGISLTVTGTDVRYQRFEGYLALAKQGRFVRLFNVSAEVAVPFYTAQGQGDQAYDLVVTTVNQDGVVGYLLVPKGESSGSGETASGTPTPDTLRSPGGSF